MHPAHITYDMKASKCSFYQLPWQNQSIYWLSLCTVICSPQEQAAVQYGKSVSEIQPSFLKMAMGNNLFCSEIGFKKAGSTPPSKAMYSIPPPRPLSASLVIGCINKVVLKINNVFQIRKRLRKETSSGPQ